MPVGLNSTIISMSSHHSDPINGGSDQGKRYLWDILCNIIPKHWQSYLQHDKFEIIKCSITDFFDMMECYQLTNHIDPSLKQQHQSKTNKDELNKSSEKPNDKSTRPNQRKLIPCTGAQKDLHDSWTQQLPYD
jgi:hypothetical protein